MGKPSAVERSAAGAARIAPKSLKQKPIPGLFRTLYIDI
jgi:hypothetical protein